MGEIKIGAREVLKAMEKGEIKRVVIAKNAPEDIKKKIIEVASTKNIEVEEGDDELKLGTTVGKPFPVAVVGYQKGEEEE